MAENIAATEALEVEGVDDGVGELSCDPVDFQSFEDEIRELMCPKVGFVSYISI
jgi:hypothetical protein